MLIIVNRMTSLWNVYEFGMIVNVIVNVNVNVNVSMCWTQRALCGVARRKNVSESTNAKRQNLTV